MAQTISRFRLVMLAASLVTAVATLVVIPVAAQRAAVAGPPAAIPAALAADAGTLSDKFSGLATAMAGKYDWRPGTGVRSVGDVFNLILNENRALSAAIGAPVGAGPSQPITDPAAMSEALKQSYAALQKVIGGLSDADLAAPAQLFGRSSNRQGILLMVLMDQHEHLGQSIAYARTNGVVPPWSK